MKQLIRSTILFSQVGLSAWPRRSALGRSLNFCPGEGPLRKILDRPALFSETEVMKQLSRLTTLFCACAALALTVVAGPEPLPSGKEMKQVAPAPVPECFNWTGFYVGGFGGFKFASVDTNLEATGAWFSFPVDKAAIEDHAADNLDADGAELGGLLGYNYQ